MPFTDQKLAQNIGFMILQLWKLSAEKEDLEAKLPQTPPPMPPQETR